MRFDILTLFPDMMQAVLGESIIGRAVEKRCLELNYVNIRDFADNRHNRVDDYPYGGGKGMVMQPMPIYKAYQSVASGTNVTEKPHVIYMSPQGKVFCQEDAIRLSKYEHIVILCGHYEGVDERVLEEIVDEEISAGDYVLTGGEIPAMMVVDAVARMLPGVLSTNDSFEKESLYAGLLEYPQYTRPPEFLGKKVPEVLLSGHHVNIEAWQKKESLKRTLKKRPELLETAPLSKNDKKILDDMKAELEGKPMNLTEKRKSSKTIYDGKVIRVEKDIAVLPNGHEAIREVVRHPGGVAVVAVDDEGFVYMVRQFRYPIMKETLEIPAGKLDKNEETQVAAERELLEETGLVAGKIKLLGRFYATPGFCDEQLSIYLATQLRHGEAHPDEDEFLSCEKYPLLKLVEMVQAGEITDAKTAIGILMAKDQLL